MATPSGTPIFIDQAGSESLLRPAPLGSNEYDESWLQDLVFHHPSCLPIGEIDKSYTRLVPICREMNTPVGPIDVLYATAEGKLVIVEAKLWRNPEARRKVLGQILDYAKELSRWSYDDLQREVSKALGGSRDAAGVLFGTVSRAYPEVVEHEFVDAISRCLRRGDFLLLIVGDGIREEVAGIAEYLDRYGTLHFTFGLVEMRIFTLGAHGFLVQPTVLTRSVIVKRTVVSLASEQLSATESLEDDADEPEELSEGARFYFGFWKEFVANLHLDDPSQPKPNVLKQGNVFLSMPARSNAWLTVFFFQERKEVGVFLTFNRGPLGDMIFEHLLADREQIDRELVLPADWKSKDGKHKIAVRKRFPDLRDPEYRLPIRLWLSEQANRFVNAFRPRIERILEDA